MSKRTIDEVKVGFDENFNSVISLRFRVRGGRTGDHFVQYLSGEWFCDCYGFISHKKCRHVKAGEVIMKHIMKALDEIEIGEKNEWRN